MPIFFHSKAAGFKAVWPEKLKAPTLTELFSNLPEYLGKIPERDRHDFYYSLAQTKAPRQKDEEGTARGTWASANWIRQEALAFDIDGMEHDDLRKVEAYGDTVASVLGVPGDELTLIRSGHGLHFLVFLETPIEDYQFFTKFKPLYTELCDQMEKKLKAQGLSGKLDRAVFDHARIFRLPGTENRKREPFARCELVQLSLKSHAVDLGALSGVPVAKATEQLTPAETKRVLRNPDTASILRECEQLRWAAAHGPLVKEPFGYKLLSVLARFPDDRQTAHAFYRQWTGSTSLMATDPDKKMDQALTASRPTLCKTLESLGGVHAENCGKCIHYGKIESPMSIKGQDFIPSESDHFWDVNENGKKTPNFDDLLKAFIRERHYFVQAENSQIWSFNGTHYEKTQPILLKAWVENVMQPKPKDSVRREFQAKILSNCVKPASAFDPFFKRTQGKINLKNGVLDTKTRELTPHSPELGFRYVFPYEYDPSARAPLFLQFVHDIFISRQELMDTYQDFLACLLWSGYEGLDAAFWWFAGIGDNGKSTALEIAEAMIGGEGNFSHFKPNNFTDRFSLSHIEGQLLCTVEEVNSNFLSGEVLGMVKDLSAGGKILVERKGVDHWMMTNTAKFVFTSNKEPTLGDVTPGLRRRFITLPFDVNFRSPEWIEKRDPQFYERMLPELPGILNWALDGMDKLRARKNVPFVPQYSKDHFQELAQNSNSFEQWFHEHLEVTDRAEDFIPSADAHSDYVSWLRAENYQERFAKATTRTQFGRQVRAKTSAAIRALPDQRKIDGHVVRVLVGVRRKEEIAPDY